MSGCAAAAVDGAAAASATATGTAANRRVARGGVADTTPLDGAGVGELNAPDRVSACAGRVATARARPDDDFLTGVATATEDAFSTGSVGDCAAAAVAACDARSLRRNRIRMRPPATAPISATTMRTAATTNAAGRMRRICARIRATDPSGKKSSMPSSIRRASRSVVRPNGASAWFAEVRAISSSGAKVPRLSRGQPPRNPVMREQYAATSAV